MHRLAELIPLVTLVCAVACEAAPQPSVPTKEAEQEAESPPMIWCSPDMITLDWQIGDEPPPPQTVRLSREGSRDLRWEIVNVPKWLSLEPRKGVLYGQPEVLGCAVDVDGLTPGEHVATPRIYAPAAYNSPQTLTVEVLVEPRSGDEKQVIDFVHEIGATLDSYGLIADEWNELADKYSGRAWDVSDKLAGLIDDMAAVIGDFEGVEVPFQNSDSAEWETLRWKSHYLADATHRNLLLALRYRLQEMKAIRSGYESGWLDYGRIRLEETMADDYFEQAWQALDELCLAYGIDPEDQLSVARPSIRE